MKTKSIFLLLVALIYIGCAGDDSVVPSQKIKGSLFVTVKDPAGLPVNGATIHIGDLTGTSNEDGTYFFTQATLTGEDYLSVEKPGYFKGSRRFKTIESHTQFFSITLLPQTEVGNFSAEQSAVITIDSKSRLTFPDHAVTREDGSAYNGNVNVLANPIYGDDLQLSEKMPGTLIGLDQSGTKVALGSLGMLAVELQADNGDVLKIASGKTVEMQLGIPDQQISMAPSTIPLWYFDDSKGYWVQEGQAIRQGNAYVAQLPHFSFWNWDQTFTAIDWQARFIYTDGKPAQNTRVCLTIKSLNDQRCAYTDANGMVSGPLPANEALELEVRNECGNIIHTQQLGPFSNDVKMDAVILDVSEQYSATVSGTALQCDGSPLASGFVRVNTGLNDFIFPIEDAEGHYAGRYVYCAGDVVTLKVYDVVHNVASLPHVITFDRDLDAGNIKACDQAQVDEYLRYKINGFSREYNYFFLNVTPGSSTRVITLDSIGVKGKFGFTFDGFTTGQYKGYTLLGNQINIQNGQTAYVLKMDVNVTQYGLPGEYIRGNFSGKITAGGNGAGGSGDSDFNGSFSVKNR
ncbi:MAG: carboxypeptidase-like regulatory domain-containing protein [Saprospiraceae bacterium]